MKFVASLLLAAFFGMAVYYAGGYHKPTYTDRWQLYPDQSRPALPTLPMKLPTGQVSYLNFWAYWCIPCLEEMPLLDQLGNDLGDSLNIVLINIDSDDEKKRLAAEYLKEFPELNNIYDLALSQTLEIAMLPYHILVDKNGRMGARFYGNLKDKENRFRELVRQLQDE